jgi:DNA polymerase V
LGHGDSVHDDPVHDDPVHGDPRRGSAPHPLASGSAMAAACDRMRPEATASPAVPAAPPAAPLDLDLARLLIPDPRRSLLLRVCGESMRDAGIRHGDLLVVERSRPTRSGAIVVARLGDCFTLKRLQWRQGRCWLEPAHPAYPPLDLERIGRRQGLTGADVQVWGVAVHVIRAL